VLTITGTAVNDKHWITLQASKDPALAAKAAGRAFELSSYRYDAIFRPLEQLLVPKTPPAAAKPAAAKPAGSKPAAVKPTPKPVPAPQS